MRHLRPALGIFAAALALAGCAPRPASSVVRPEGTAPALPAGIPETRAHEVACELTDAAGPRLAGSPGDALSREWAVAEMRRIGLANVREEPVTVPHWERGPISVEVVAPAPQPLVATALGGSVSTPEGGITAEVLRVESREALAQLPDDVVRGKIVFFDKKMERRRDGFPSYGATVDVRGRGPSAAAKKGAVAVVIRSIATSTARFPHTGSVRYADDAPKIPSAALAVPDADLLARLVARGPVTLKLELSATQHPDAQSANVIGEVTGREKPDEIVLLGAHLDSWDLGPGAVDDAAGVGVVLEVARLLLAEPPRRTVRIVLFANEENGLKGAYAYAKAYEGTIDKHHAAMELDAGAGLAYGLSWYAGEGASPAMARIFQLLRPLGVEDYSPRNPRAGGADLIPLEDAGVPRVQLKQDARRYFDLHHTADDTCDKIVPAELTQVTAAAWIVTRELAEMSPRLPFAPATPAPSPTPAATAPPAR